MVMCMKPKGMCIQEMLQIFHPDFAGRKQTAYYITRVGEVLTILSTCCKKILTESEDFESAPCQFTLWKCCGFVADYKPSDYFLYFFLVFLVSQENPLWLICIIIDLANQDG